METRRIFRRMMRTGKGTHFPYAKQTELFQKDKYGIIYKEKIGGLEMTEKAGIFVNNVESTRSVKVNVQLTSRQKQVFKDWFETGVESYDETRKDVFVFRDRTVLGFKEIDSNKDKTFHDHLTNTFFTPSNLSIKDMIKALMTKDTEDFVEDTIETLCLFLYKYTFSVRKIDEFIYEFGRSNSTLNGFLEEWFHPDNYNLEDEEELCCLDGFSPKEYYYVKHIESILDASIMDSSIAKKLKKLCETRLSEMLHINYKKIGLKSLSKTMEYVFAKSDGNIKLTNTDKGVCSLIYILMTIDYANTVACHSVFADYLIKTSLNNRESNISLLEKKGEAIENIEQYDFEEATSYFYDNANSLMKKASNEDILAGYLYYGDVSRKLRFEDAEDTFSKHLETIKLEVASRYTPEQWQSLTTSKQSLVFAKMVISYHLRLAIFESSIWFPFLAKKADSETVSPQPQIKENNPPRNSKKKKKHDKALDKLKAENLKNLERVKEYKDKWNKTSSELSSVKKEAKKLQSQLHAKEQEIARIKSEEDSKKLSDSERDELYRLREFAFSLSSEEASSIDLNTNEIDESLIRNYGTIVLVGGHSTLYRNLSEKYENIRVIDGRSRVSFDKIRNSKFVFFLFSFISHSSYYQGCNECAKADIPFGYIEGTNLRKAEEQIIKQIRTQEEKVKHNGK